MSHLSRESVSSIQLALELEHELDDGEHHHPTSSQQKPGDKMSAVDPLSTTEYDSEVLTSIIIQLRANLATITQERDESNQALAESGHKYAALEAKAADLEELLEAEKKRAEKAEAERDEALKNAQENEEQVNLLRAKVEESRRGVMRLQAESRRMSTQTLKTGPLPLDLSAAAGARSPGLVSGFSNTAKRASFQLPPPSAFGSGTPNQPTSRPMGMGHRRISSLSDPGPNGAPTPNRSSTMLSDPVNIIDGLPPSPVTHTFQDMKNGDGTTIKTKRLSLVAKRDHSPPGGLPPASVLTAELDSVRGELSNTRKELENVKHELAEAIDKREASDACIKALREFIAEQAIGESAAVVPSSSSIKDDASSVNSVRSPVVSLKGLRLPPLPSEENIPEDAASSTGPKKGGWGLRLWNTPASEASSAPAATPQVAASSSSSTAATPASTPLTSFVSSWTRSVSGGTQAPATSSSSTQPAATSAQPEPSAAAPATGLRKFSLFGSKAPSVPATPAPNAKDPQTVSMHSTAPSISSSRTPDLVHSVSTSPQTDTRSVTSGAMSEEEEHEAAAAKLAGIEGTTVFLDPSYGDKNTGDVTPTLSSSAVSVNSDSAHPERLETVAL